MIAVFSFVTLVFVTFVTVGTAIGVGRTFLDRVTAICKELYIA